MAGMRVVKLCSPIFSDMSARSSIAFIDRNPTHGHYLYYTTYRHARRRHGDRTNCGVLHLRLS